MAVSGSISSAENNASHSRYLISRSGVVKWGVGERGEQEGGAPESGLSYLDGVEMGDIKGGLVVLEFLY